MNRWEPANVMKALDSGLVDCVQVVYNVFDQDPEDVLFPYCREHGIAIIARVPFDEGSLTGTLRPDATWPAGDWRNLYFTPAQLRQTLDRVERLMPLVPPGQTLPELALRFILHHPRSPPPSQACGGPDTSGPTWRPATARPSRSRSSGSCAPTGGRGIGRCPDLIPAVPGAGFQVPGRVPGSGFRRPENGEP